ncbi:hydroxymethylglutaryl-coenzyme A reductase family protein [Xylogone sp. PMI_703]|nr:hydroxymethylglutaryl-coenzyme A reductase family protein [Xylogone sp. PMI_703]
MSRKQTIEKLAEKFPSARNSNTENIKIENCIGFTRVPLGLAGPLTIHGKHERTVYAPLATSEATLIASCSRGCKAFQSLGGIKATVLSETLSRAPVFGFASVDDAVKFYHFVPSLKSSFQASVQKTSRYARLVNITPHVIGKVVHVKFEYTCGDAAGQNMVTIATHRACKEFLASDASKDLGIVDFVIEGQFSSDKKASWESIRNGRGVEVMVWGSVSDAVCQKVLGTTTTRLHSTISIFSKGSTRAGHIGNSINTANILAAFFIACGQDAASVFESGWSHLTTDLDEKTKTLTLTLYFPNLIVGTMGGGTQYPTQREALEFIGCYGEGKKLALAETIAAFALALDISTVSAMANDTFSQSHQDLARDQPQSKL